MINRISRIKTVRQKRINSKSLCGCGGEYCNDPKLSVDEILNEIRLITRTLKHPVSGKITHWGKTLRIREGCFMEIIKSDNLTWVKENPKVSATPVPYGTYIKSRLNLSNENVAKRRQLQKQISDAKTKMKRYEPHSEAWDRQAQRLADHERHLNSLEQGGNHDSQALNTLDRDSFIESRLESGDSLEQAQLLANITYGESNE